MIRTIATKFNFFLLYSSENEKLVISKILDNNFPDSKHHDGSFTDHSPAIILSRKTLPKEYHDSEKFKNLISKNI